MPLTEKVKKLLTTRSRAKSVIERASKRKQEAADSFKRMHARFKKASGKRVREFTQGGKTFRDFTQMSPDQAKNHASRLQGLRKRKKAVEKYLRMELGAKEALKKDTKRRIAAGSIAASAAIPAGVYAYGKRKNK